MAEVFKEKCLAKIKELEGVRNSIVISRQKYDTIVEVLKGEIQDNTYKKEMKKRNYNLITLPDLDLKDVLVLSNSEGMYNMY